MCRFCYAFDHVALHVPSLAVEIAHAREFSPLGAVCYDALMEGGVQIIDHMLDLIYPHFYLVAKVDPDFAYSDKRLKELAGYTDLA